MKNTNNSQIIINEVKTEYCSEIYKQIEPNYVKNRFDLLKLPGWQNFIFEINSGTESVFVPVRVGPDTAELGTYLRNIDVNLIRHLTDYLWKRFPHLEEIKCLHLLNAIPGVEPRPHWHIDLPSSLEEFDKQLSHDIRYNTHRYARKLKEMTDYTFVKFSADETDDSIILQYLSWKKSSHQFVWNLSPGEFLSACGITDVYVIRSEKEIIAVGFVCITGENAFFENMSYNIDYARHSPGKLLYYNIIGDLISRGFKKFYLLGGDCEYKRNYNGILTQTYSTIWQRHPLMNKWAEKIPASLARLPLTYSIKKKLLKLFSLFFFNRYFAGIAKGKLKFYHDDAK